MLFFVIGLCYGANTFFTAAKVRLSLGCGCRASAARSPPATGSPGTPSNRTRPQIYIESYHSVPQGHCQVIVKYMAWTFFTSWVMFPILFAAGHEGLGLLSPYGSTIGHTVADLLSKNLWGLLGHHLRVKVRRP